MDCISTIIKVFRHHQNFFKVWLHFNNNFKPKIVISFLLQLQHQELLGKSNFYLLWWIEWNIVFLNLITLYFSITLTFLFQFLEHELYIDGRVPDFSTFTSPKLLATHVPFASLPKSVQHSKTKLVYLCRNPRDTFISMWHFTNNLLLHHNDTNSIEETFDLFCEGVSLYGPFWNHVLAYWEKSIENPTKILFLMYE